MSWLWMWKLLSSGIWSLPEFQKDILSRLSCLQNMRRGNSGTEITLLSWRWEISQQHPQVSTRCYISEYNNLHTQQLENNKSLCTYFFRFKDSCKTKYNCTNFEVLTAVSRNTIIWWNIIYYIKPCSLVAVYRRFGRTFCPNFQDRRMIQIRKQQEENTKQRAQ
jgi:hypothetical protein